ncbi:hypothetical protein R1sor_000804 [Riccia sorocarpa]|uniref:Uncharacterized protein n=1 Tax=Riccia sorocarpa TaxID=122646 RepID=A0ABD3GWK2_9MARC
MIREEEDESEDQVIYRHDSPNELLGLYRQRHQLKAKTAAPGTVSKDTRRPEPKSVKLLLPPSAVEEAAWASLTQANVNPRAGSQRHQELGSSELHHQHLNSTERHQGEINGDVPGKFNWTDTLQQLLSQDVHRDENRVSVSEGATCPPRGAHADVELAENNIDPPGEANAVVQVAQNPVESINLGARIAGQGSRFQPERKFEPFGSAKGKQKRPPAERFRINTTRAPLPAQPETGPVPLAQRLQQLVEEDCRQDQTPPHQGSGASSSTPLSITGRLQSLIESSGPPRAYQQQLPAPRVVSKHSPSKQRRPVSTVQIKKAAIQDDIVDCLDEDEDGDGVQGSSRYLQTPVQRSRGARNLHKRHPAYKNEPVEDIDNYDDFFDQEASKEKSLSESVSTAPTSISDRFRDALLSSAPPEVTGATSFALSARLEAVLSAQKNKQMQFTKSLQGKHRQGKLGQCLEVRINATKDEAQLTVCRCEVLCPPEDWIHERNSQKVSSDCGNNPSLIDVIFSKVSSGVEFHVGRMVRIHPPWQEVPRGEQSIRLIFCTFFCEVLP